MRNISGKLVKKIKTNIFILNNVFSKFCSYEIMWKNMVQPESPQMTIYYGAEEMLECRHPLIIFNTYCLCTSVLCYMYLAFFLQNVLMM